MRIWVYYKPKLEQFSFRPNKTEQIKTYSVQENKIMNVLGGQDKESSCVIDKLGQYVERCNKKIKQYKVRVTVIK